MSRVGVQASLQRCRVGIYPCPRVDVGMVLPDGVQKLQGVLLDTLLHDPPTLRTPYAARGSVRPPEPLPLRGGAPPTLLLVGRLGGFSGLLWGLNGGDP